MLLRNTVPAGQTPARTRLDAAIVVSVLAMVALNLLALTGQIAPKAYAATTCDCVAKGIVLQ